MDLIGLFIRVVCRISGSIELNVRSSYLSSLQAHQHVNKQTNKVMELVRTNLSNVRKQVLKTKVRRCSSSIN
jgi:hypothetical protein